MVCNHTDRSRLTNDRLPCDTYQRAGFFDVHDLTRRERRWPVGEMKLVRAILAIKDLPAPITPPAEPYVSPASGVVVLRTGLEPDDLQLTCYTKRTGAIGVHGTRDLTSILLYGYGAPLIVHPSRSYGRHAMAVEQPPAPCKSWNDYRVGVWSHSVAAVGGDGGAYHGRGYQLRHVSDAALGVEAVVADAGTGYFGRAAPKGHFRRTILMVKNPKGSTLPGKGYFVLVDDVLDVPTDADTHWLLQPRGEKIEGDGDTKTWTSYDFLGIPPKPVRLMVHWVRPADSAVTMKTGIWAPPADLSSMPHGKPKGEPRPFPDITWTGPGRMITVLYPLAEGMKAPAIKGLPDRKGVAVGSDTIRAELDTVALTRGDEVFVVPLQAAKEK
jgi:hypothetical protein